METKEKRRVDTLFTLALVGDCCVGKSSILARCGKDEFSDNYSSTIGVNFKNKYLDHAGRKI